NCHEACASCLQQLLAATVLDFLKQLRCNTTTNDRIYNYNATILEGSRTVTFSDYRGKSVLFVNVATY
uniref:Uncharacterized protein n=1 Tax=Cynoglossus semilaevis TaxID=244447 RepID=A0A3P8WKR6_CYNSE